MLQMTGGFSRVKKQSAAAAALPIAQEEGGEGGGSSYTVAALPTVGPLASQPQH
jgi:hypothetical protein